MTKLGITLFCALAAAAALVVGPGAAGAAAYHEYVALGDSWSADVFTSMPPATAGGVPVGCAQSRTDYPHQVARALHIAVFRDATCGSATTEDMTQPQSVPLNGTNPPQFDRLTPTTDLVTLGIGGNDIGLAGDVEECLSPVPTGSVCKQKFTAGGVDQISAAIKASAPKIAGAIGGIRARSPHARILLVNYLNGIPASGRGCWPVVPVTNTDVAYLQAKFVEMNAMLADVAQSSGVQLVDTYTPTLGHDVCKAPTVRYVEGVVPVSVRNPLLLAFPFHPNEGGARAQASIVRSAIVG